MMEMPPEQGTELTAPPPASPAEAAPDQAPAAQQNDPKNDPAVQIMAQNVAKIPPEVQQELVMHMTPEVVSLIGALFGPNVAMVLEPLIQKDMRSMPVSRKAVERMGTEKVNNFFQKAHEKATGLVPNPNQGGAAQAPQGPAMPNGLMGR